MMKNVLAGAIPFARSSVAFRKPDCDAVHPNRKGQKMVPWEWIETFGHATNYYPYRCVRLEDL